MGRRKKGLPINGILLLNKPLGLSSNKALQQTKHLYQAQKAGHTGSLDPLATGMLPICFGEATKVCAHLLDSNKAYRAEITLGIKTSTEDGEGEITHQQIVPEYSQEKIDEVLAQFKGEISQVPPMHSALWHEGKRLYEIARAGEVVDIKPRQVTILSLEQEGPIVDNKLTIKVECTKGTYIRSLSRDIGEVFGCGAYMSALDRLHVDPFKDLVTYSLESLEGEGFDLQSILIPVDYALQKYSACMLTPEESDDIFMGRKIVTKNKANLALEASETVRLYRQKSPGSPGSEEKPQFLGLGNYEGEGLVSPKRLMHLV